MWNGSIFAKYVEEYVTETTSEMTYISSLFSREKVPRAFCASDRRSSDNSDSRYPPANRKVFQAFRKWENEALHIYMTQLKSLSEYLSAFTSWRKSALQQGLHPEDCCRFSRILRRVSALVLFTYTLSLLPGIHSSNLRSKYFSTSGLSFISLS